MGKYRVGSVPYVNAAPLVWWFEQEGSPVDVVYAVPSELPALLQSGEVDCILVSSIYALTHPNSALAGEVGIVSDGPVQSVRILSTVPPAHIKTLALDESSMTSNLLAQIVLKYQFDVQPTLTKLPPNLDQMLDVCDACVLIGDKGLEASGEGLHILDLGECWKELTSLPFLWAGWVGSTDLDLALVPHLQRALEESGFGKVVDPERQELVCQWASARARWSIEVTRNYLRNHVKFLANESVKQGLAKYRQLANELGVTTHDPNWHQVQEANLVAE